MNYECTNPNRFSKLLAMKTGLKMVSRFLCCLLFCACSWLFLFNIASAEALVVVKLRDPDGNPAEGTVTLKASGKEGEYKCKTSKGACNISGVPGGTYNVIVVPASGSSPPPRKVMIPPSGKVELFVSTANSNKKS